jgi:hypothetical protein
MPAPSSGANFCAAFGHCKMDSDMDLAKYILFGDRHLMSQYYVVVHPIGTAVFLTALVLPPWIGAWLAGKRGLWTAVALQLLAIGSLHAYALTRPFLDEDFASDVAFMALRTSVVSVVVVALSAILAWVWLRWRIEGRASDN